MEAEYRGMRLIVPDNDTEFKGYFEAARRRELVVKRCAACGRLRFPPGAACPWCQSLDWTWQPVSGRGTIYSYEVVHQAIQPGFHDWTPYVVVLVELDEQAGQPTPDEALRLLGNLLTADLRPEVENRVAIGQRVEVAFQDLSPDMALPQWRLSDEPPRGRPWRLPA
jgi:uncharacterized OB-fold protein